MTTVTKLEDVSHGSNTADILCHIDAVMTGILWTTDSLIDSRDLASPVRLSEAVLCQQC